jgi:hypothetical protein
VVTLADIASVVALAGVVLLHVRLSGIASRLNSLQRTGVLIEDAKSAKQRQMKVASPRERQKYIERVINQGVKIGN